MEEEEMPLPTLIIHAVEKRLRIFPPWRHNKAKRSLMRISVVAF